MTPSYDLKTLWVLADKGNSLTRIDPVTGRSEQTIPVADPYNMYYTPDGKYAIVVAERKKRLDFRDAQTMAIVNPLPVPCRGVDHMDFSASGRYLIASCEFSAEMLKVDVAAEKLLGTLKLPGRAMPQDVRLSPDGSAFLRMRSTLRPVPTGTVDLVTTTVRSPGPSARAPAISVAAANT